jgi:hypothetical protein
LNDLISSLTQRDSAARGEQITTSTRAEVSASLTELPQLQAV